MNTQQAYHYERIAQAIAFIDQEARNQPGLEEIAQHVHMSPHHFQRMFTQWAGVSPKKFLQYISISHAKQMLKKDQVTLFEAAHNTGLSGTGRLHDLFISIEGMTPGEYKNGGKSLTINYSFAESPFGSILIASTSKGVCHMAFVDQHKAAREHLEQTFLRAKFKQYLDHFQQNALFIFTQDWRKLDQIKLHLKGTPFQLKVWETLLNIPMGGLTSYGSLAQKIGHSKASRAVGTAVGSNPVAYLIPCHRVIQATGKIGQYHWGSSRKTAMIGWEAAKTNA